VVSYPRLVSFLTKSYIINIKNYGGAHTMQNAIILLLMILLGSLFCQAIDTLQPKDSAHRMEIINTPEHGSHIQQLQLLINHMALTVKNRNTEEFLYNLVRSETFSAEIAKRQGQEWKTLRGWRVPLGHELSQGGELRYEWGLLFRLAEFSRTRRQVPVCLVYVVGAHRTEVEYLGYHHWLPDLKVARQAILVALEKRT